MEEVEYIPVSLLAEMLYCPRNFYYRMIEKADEQNVHMLRGKIEDEARNQRKQTVRGEKTQMRRVVLSSDSLQLIAELDILEESDEVYPVEYKTGLIREKIHDDVQLCAQAMLVEEYLQRPVYAGFVYYHGSHARRKVVFEESLRTLVFQTIEEAKHLIDKNIVPPPVNDERCHGCSLQPRCLPGEMEKIKTNRPVSRPTPFLNADRVLYVEEQGTYIRKQGERLLITKENQLLREVPVHMVDEVVLIGAAHLSHAVVQLLLQKNIPVSYLTIHGNYAGAYIPAFSKNSMLRIAQYKVYADEQERLEFAKKFVTGKIHNM